MPKKGDIQTSINIDLAKATNAFMQKNGMELKDLVRFLQPSLGSSASPRASDILAGRRNTQTYAKILVESLFNGDWDYLRGFCMDSQAVRFVDNEIFLSKLDQPNVKKYEEIMTMIRKEVLAGNADKLLKKLTK
jgi:hypothetical protein